ncbi:uncharacterized protein LOC34621749 [Cyclospora cayetanensis]|uniref:Uncharacterized protein LOC34621749 n=1 Tax=Cyclospora cayetanensis TaxID=88456 RepID=A0A6P6RYR3_9EIME|nr:uncharacterized protein LOC34621749 [Cyclospora cayetanensis]
MCYCRAERREMETEDRRSRAVSMQLHQLTYEQPHMAWEDSCAQWQRKLMKEQRQRMLLMHRSLLLVSLLDKWVERSKDALQRHGLALLKKAFQAAAAAQRRHQAAALLQRTWRSSCLRALAKQTMRELRVQHAARQLAAALECWHSSARQRLARGALQQLQQHAANLKALSSGAVTAIAAAWRGYAARKAFRVQRALRVFLLPQNKVYRCRLEKLQAIWRGGITRQQLRKRGLRLPCDKEKHLYATKIQTVLLGAERHEASAAVGTGREVGPAVETTAADHSTGPPLALR